MRHIFIRGILAAVWFLAAMMSGKNGRLEMTILYIILGGLFLYSAYTTWKKERDHKGES